MLSLTRSSLTAAIRHVYSADPALDKDSPDYSPEDFRKTGDLRHMPARGSEKVTVFELRPLSMRRMQRITSMRPLDGTFTTEQFGEAVAYGLKAVHDLEVDGKPVELQFDRGSEERLKEKSLAAIYKTALFVELGGRILEISDLSF